MNVKLSENPINTIRASLASPTTIHAIGCWLESALVLAGLFHSWCQKLPPPPTHTHWRKHWGFWG